MAQASETPVEPSTTSPAAGTGLRPGDRDHWRAIVALVAAGLASFNAMFATQALLPTLTEDLGVSPASASLTVSALTGMLALSIIPVSILSERFGRGRVMISSAVIATLLGIALSFSPNIGILIAGRAIQGVFVAGVPAVAMAWLAEEMHPDALGSAMGRYVAGTTVGGLLGRLVPAGVLEFASWHVAMLVTSAVAFAFAVLLALMLPAQRCFVPKRIRLGNELRALAGHWRNPRMASLFALAFLLMGVFVSLYNYLGFRLRSEFGFSEATVGIVFLLYLVGTWTSARAGAFATRLGRAAVVRIGIILTAVGLALTLTHTLWLVLLGVAVLTGGFFAAHATASGWVGALAVRHRAEASSTYLFCYYLGSSVIGYASGFRLHDGGWPGLVLALG
ncbi:MFS transporter, partial [Dietzia sp.]|uniref:MFS transporter n=1 Tax=Dietzia sp. TaxID=1871616 RepID=UPI002FD9CE58